MKLIRLLILAAGVVLALQPAPAFQLGACYATMNTTPDTICANCCANGDTPIRVTTDGSGTGNMDFGTATVDCGGESSPGSCYPNDGSTYCPSNASYQNTITNVSCGGGGGSSCSHDSDCVTPYVCTGGGTCGICTTQYNACSSDGDCCSANCTVFDICGPPRF